MSDHHGHGGAEATAEPVEGGSWKLKMVFLILALVVFVTIYRQRSAHEKKELEVKQAAAKAWIAAHPQSLYARGSSSGVVYATTPATITADYEFNIEADGVIMMGAPGIKAVKHIPGQGFQQAPEPRMGPKSFWDPRDSTGGHISFRLYPVRNGR